MTNSADAEQNGARDAVVAVVTDWLLTPTEPVAGDRTGVMEAGGASSELPVADDLAAVAGVDALVTALTALATPLAPSESVWRDLVAALPNPGAQAALAPQRFRPWLGPLADLFDVGTARMAELLTLIDRPAAWEAFPGAPGVHLVHFTGGARCVGADTGFVRVAVGDRFPRHEHLGEEITFVLAGRGRDSDGRLLAPGDVVTLAAGTVHDFSSDGDEPLLIAVRVFGVKVFPRSE